MKAAESKMLGELHSNVGGILQHLEEGDRRFKENREEHKAIMKALKTNSDEILVIKTQRSMVAVVFGFGGAIVMTALQWVFRRL